MCVCVCVCVCVGGGVSVCMGKCACFCVHNFETRIMDKRIYVEVWIYCGSYIYHCVILCYRTVVMPKVT